MDARESKAFLISKNHNTSEYRIIDATANKIGLDQSKVIKNIHKYGNTTGATIPLAIGDAIDDGKLKKGDLVLFAAVGAGFTSGCVLARWTY